MKKTYYDIMDISIEQLKNISQTYSQQYQGMCKQRAFSDAMCNTYYQRFKYQLPEQLDEMALLCRQFLKFYDMSENLEKQTLEILAEGRVIDDYLINGKGIKK